MSNGRNSEGYPDPTPCEAERNIEYERRHRAAVLNTPGNASRI